MAEQLGSTNFSDNACKSVSFQKVQFFDKALVERLSRRDLSPINHKKWRPSEELQTIHDDETLDVADSSGEESKSSSDTPTTASPASSGSQNDMIAACLSAHFSGINHGNGNDKENGNGNGNGNDQDEDEENKSDMDSSSLPLPLASNASFVTHQTEQQQQQQSKVMSMRQELNELHQVYPSKLKKLKAEIQRFQQLTAYLVNINKSEHYLHQIIAHKQAIHNSLSIGLERVLHKEKELEALQENYRTLQALKQTTNDNLNRIRQRYHYEERRDWNTSHSRNERIRNQQFQQLLANNRESERKIKFLKNLIARKKQYHAQHAE